VIRYSGTYEKALPNLLSDAEWAYMEPHLPTPKTPGRPRVHSLREILNAIFYIVRSGYAWRLLSHGSRPERPFTTTKEFGASTVPGRSYTLRCANVCEYASRGILNLVRA
jgi:transposase